MPNFKIYPNAAETFAIEDVSRYGDGVRIIPDILILNHEHYFVYKMRSFL